jgi:glycosyltransferase involved in cell wall biosynthesis
MTRTDTVRVYVDQTHVGGHITGIERVALELFSPSALPGFDVRPVRSRGLLDMIAGQQLTLPGRAARERGALFVFPGYPPGPLALASRERAFIYVHDTFLLTRPDDLNWRARLYMRPSFALAVRYGRRFLVNSEATGKALRAWTGSRASISLLRPAASDVFQLADLPLERPRHPGSALRLVAIGTIEPRKNYAGAVSIVHALRRAGIEAELDIVGRFGWGDPGELRDPPPFIRVHGYLNAGVVRQLLAEANALLCTSHAEGLGLPLVEVQHGGVPVVAPEGEVFREVLGTSALFVDPAKPDEAAKAIAAWATRGEVGARAAAARANVARWNGLAAQDAERFRQTLASAAAALQARRA